MKRSILLLIIVFLSTIFSIPAFPGAEGFGAISTGGFARGLNAGKNPTIYKVTTLADSGTGSLRSCVDGTGPRICIFEVSGEIKITKQLRIDDPYITIAGQTAPPPGIMISSNPTSGGYADFRVGAHDIIIQHIIVRHTARDGHDAIDVRVLNPSFVYNIIMDHISVSWGDDETFSFAAGDYSGCPSDTMITFSNNIIAEGITGSGYGTLISQFSNKFSFIKNLIMSHQERLPRVHGAVTLNIINNVAYNSAASTFTAIGSTFGPSLLSIIGNVYINGPNTINSRGFGVTSDIQPGSEIYESDNIATQSIYSSATTPYLVGTKPVPEDDTYIIPSSLVKNYVLSHAGARPAERGTQYGDYTDERLINEVKTGGGSIKSSIPSYPAIAHNTRTLNIPSNPHEDSGDGYTNIEKFIHTFSCQVEGQNSDSCGACPVGWTGPNCDTPVCNPVCNDHQYCANPDTCNCRNLWEGVDCNTPMCINPQCTGNSECTAPNVCSCIDGWTGDHCNIPEGICTPECNINQECDPNQNCICKTGWTGDCFTPECDIQCKEHQNCSSPNTCSCVAGWIGLNCDKRDCNGHYSGLVCESCEYGWAGENCETYLLKGNWEWALPVGITTGVLILLFIIVVLIVVSVYIKVVKNPKALSNVDVTSNDMEELISSKIDDGSKSEI